MNVKIEQSWKEVLQREFEQDYFCNLVAFVKQEYASGTVFPPGNEIFAALSSFVEENKKSLPPLSTE